ncbi:MAG: hypothetical protein AB7F40_05025 [Victivallaceae bacterium]
MKEEKYRRTISEACASLQEACAKYVSSDSREDAFYAALVSQWFENRNKETQSMITLSAGGIGLLVTLASTSGSLISLTWYFVFFPLAIFLFLIAMAIGIITYRINSNYLMDLKAYREDPTANAMPKSIGIYDSLLVCVFIMAVVSAVLFFIPHIIVSVT